MWVEFNKGAAIVPEFKPQETGFILKNNQIQEVSVRKVQIQMDEFSRILVKYSVNFVGQSPNEGEFWVNAINIAKDPEKLMQNTLIQYLIAINHKP